MAQLPSTARPVLITDAAMSREQEYETRRRRYGALMAGRVVCVIGAAVAGTVWSNIWLAGAFIAGAAILPWAAVLIANDRLPTAQRTRHAPVDVAPDRQLTAPGGTTPDHRVIDA